ncbi:MAG: hypothetical protein EPN21_05340 [Methylococcaceae bacterium]|nr:MAG: hypothetical protein EPN21_05340 [Methylococcaceae bacterium]
MNINIFLIRFLQFTTFALFLFAFLVYAFTFVLLPLAVLFQVTRLLHGIGLPVVIALLGAGGAVAYVGKTLWGMSTLCHLVWDIGMQIVTFGKAQLQRYEQVLAEYQSVVGA